MVGKRELLRECGGATPSGLDDGFEVFRAPIDHPLVDVESFLMYCLADLDVDYRASDAAIS